MKAKFNDFILQNPNCSKFAGNSDAMLIFEILSRDESIIKMIEACDHGKPALTPLAHEIEQALLNLKNPTISFHDNFTKQAVGLMIKTILKPFGYEAYVQKSLPKDAKSNEFSSASVYRIDPKSENKPTMKVVKSIVEIK